MVHLRLKPIKTSKKTHANTNGALQPSSEVSKKRGETKGVCELRSPTSCGPGVPCSQLVALFAAVGEPLTVERLASVFREEGEEEAGGRGGGCLADERTVGAATVSLDQFIVGAVAFLWDSTVRSPPLFTRTPLSCLHALMTSHANTFVARVRPHINSTLPFPFTKIGKRTLENNDFFF